MPRRSRGSSLGGRPPKRVSRPGFFARNTSYLFSLLGGEDAAGRVRASDLTDEEFMAANPALVERHPADKAEALEFDALDLCKEENEKLNNTDEYDGQDLVVRRGGQFKVKVATNVAYDSNSHKVTLQLTTGDRPLESKGTLIRMECNSAEDLPWKAKLSSAGEKVLEITIHSPPRAMIGRYKLYIEAVTSHGGEATRTKKSYGEEVTILFNPWCKDDAVYVEDPAWRHEYCLNENGLIWIGSARGFRPRRWFFGQFEKTTLDAALYLLTKAEISDVGRRSPALVSRTLTKMSNCNDGDRGVLFGRWGDSYPEGRAPWDWVGSVAILDEYMRTKRPVKYGQCWVFSGLLTSLCRALGIPARSVTNFESAHDTDVSMTIDYHWTEDGKPLEDLNRDSVWNFHVWNEGWFKRPDLPAGYDGWQAFDATPQEASEGVMQCGPASVNAIRSGDTNLPYDGKFIFAEVNGDKFHWMVREDGSMKLSGKNTKAVGKFISTKAVGRDEREDVTNNYKHPEGSGMERLAMDRALKYSEKAEVVAHVDSTNDLEVKIDLPAEVTYGDPIDIVLSVTNKTGEVRHVQGHISPTVCFYTGVVHDRLDTVVVDLTVQPGTTETMRHTTEPASYVDVLRPNYMLTTYAMVRTVEGVKSSNVSIDSTMVLPPELQIEAPEVVKQNENFTLKIKIKNPSSFTLRDGLFMYEARGVGKLMEQYRRVIKPGAEAVHEVSLQLARLGDRYIMVSFSTDKVTGLTGVAKVKVEA